MSSLVQFKHALSPPVYPGGSVFRRDDGGRSVELAFESVAKSYYSAYEKYVQAWSLCGCSGELSEKVEVDEIGRGEVRDDGRKDDQELCDTVEESMHPESCSREAGVASHVGVITGQLLGPAGGVSFGRGTNYARNQLKREKKKAEKKRSGVVPEWRRKPPVEAASSDSGYSSAGVVRGRCETVCSEALNTAQQKARETLALRRVAENEVAIAKAKALCASYADEAKCEAIQELAALRIAQRANEARAKSQSSWKKCEESLGSLGSTGSAGEFWMKKEVEKGRKWEKKYQQLKKQSEYMYANVTQQVRDDLLAMDGTVSEEDDNCAEGLEDLDEYLAQKLEVGGKSLAVMEEEFRNFKF